MKKQILSTMLVLSSIYAGFVIAQPLPSNPIAQQLPANPIARHGDVSSGLDPYVNAHGGANAMAGYVGPNGSRVMSVQRLRQSRDDTYAVLRGHVINYIGDEKYVFADETGQIRIELSWDNLPYGMTFDHTRKVEISGELDRDFAYLEFDVKHIRFL